MQKLSMIDNLQLDSQARIDFTNLKLKNRSVHVLHAGAAAGKTTLCTSLLASIGERYEGVRTLALTFNVAAAVEGQDRNECESCTWQTIYSFIFALYKEDLNTTWSHRANTGYLTACPRPSCHPRENKNLEQALNSEYCLSLKIFEAGMYNNVWWCHKLLQMKAKNCTTQSVA
ncbi:hypothetical protein JKP88DRAFT_240990 [Tribonema minus]|uniref:Uncharacterized protein n=1 Tax=Tribonema minus TaxID=303371 RepID=A0A836CK41_9STRA|nr:hypothetical protein JKP88DRAFT_240990 [Tribonema minus]